jgi:hypothetical protein
MRIVSVLGALLLTCGAASASGGLNCDASDSKVSFSVQGGVTRGMGGPLFAFEGNLEIKDKAVAEDLRKIGFELKHVAQYWFDDKELKLDIYREREGDKAHGYVELVIRTKVDGDEGSATGNYELSVYDTVGEGTEAKEAKFSGKVSCFVE